MKVLWTERAARDLEAAADYIGRSNPEAAARVAATIYHRIMSLETMPGLGRPGPVPGTREIVFNPWSYIAVYKVDKDAVRILKNPSRVTSVPIAGTRRIEVPLAPAHLTSILQQIFLP